MDTQFKAEFVDGRIRCFLTLGQPTENAVFCFSLMGPGSVVSGGNLVKRVGGFHAVQLPPLAEREVHSVDLIYDDPNIVVKNRAWLPLGSYLRIGEKCHDLPALELGVRMPKEQPFEPYRGLPLIPAPTLWAQHML